MAGPRATAATAAPQPPQQPQVQPQPASPTENVNDVVTGSAESDGGENNGDARKGYGKRELSTSKRAAQNRAAQRAFRQRKEGYIKKLEEQVRDYQSLSENFKAVQAENHQLRDYVISLQSRLLESHGEIPPPPSNVEGLQPGKSGSLPASSLPRLSELGTGNQPQDGLGNAQQAPRSGYPDPTFPDGPPDAKRPRTDSNEMTPSQSALQGSAIVPQTSTTTR